MARSAPPAQPVCTVANSQLIFTNHTSAASNDSLMAARFAMMQNEAKTLMGERSDGPADCRFEVAVALTANVGADSAEKQSFDLSKTGNKAFVSSSSSLGLVYGFYEILDRLGFRFASPVDYLTPPVIGWDRVPFHLQVSPMIEYRGFWAWGEALDDRFLLWAGRNRFNVVGGNFADKNDYRTLYGIHGWAGGHVLIANLTPTDLPVDGEMLLETHPEWFGNPPPGSNPVPFGKNNYRNPCLGNPQYAEYFAKRLVGELASNRLGKTRFINVWPSDSPTLSLSKNCTRAPGSASELDDLLFFYRSVSDRISGSGRVGQSGDRPIIAGIGYYDTFNLSHSTVDLPSANRGYLHLYYNNVRSYMKGYFDPSSSLNTQVSADFSASVSRQKSTPFGVVDYHGYSVYAGMTLGQLTSLEGELKIYANRGASFYAYMHPTFDQPPSDILLNRLISRIAFNGEPADAIIKDFVNHHFDGDQRVLQALRLLDEALQPKAEFFGPDTSLSLVVESDLAYKKAPLTVVQIAAIAAPILHGQPVNVAPIRLKYIKTVQIEGIGLAGSIEKLRAAEVLLGHVLPGLKDFRLQARVAYLKSEVERSGTIHQLLYDFASARIAASKRDFVMCREKALLFQGGIAKLRTVQWPELLRKDSMKANFIKRQEALAAFLTDKVCSDT